VNSVKTLLLVSFLLLAANLFGQAVKEHSLSNSLTPFLREGDRPLLSFSLLNKKKTDWTGSASLSLQNSNTQESVDGWFMNSVANQYFTVDTGNHHQLFFPIEVPFLFNQSLDWKLNIESVNDSIISRGTIPILSWPYEDSINTPTSTESFITIEKRIHASSPLRVGQKVLIEITLEVKKKLENLVLLDEWAAGLVPDKGPIQITGLLNKYFIENKTPRNRSIKFTTLSPGLYSLRYHTKATYQGVFNQPPTLLFLNGNSWYVARSSYQKIDIE
jgi:hypothetical protein